MLEQKTWYENKQTYKQQSRDWEIGEIQDAGKNKMVMAGFIGKIRLEQKSEENQGVGLWLPGWGEHVIQQILKTHVYLMCLDISEDAGVAAAE